MVNASDAAKLLDTEYRGKDREFHSAEPTLGNATGGTLTFCNKYNNPEEIRRSNASVIICPPEFEKHISQTAIISKNPRKDYIFLEDEYFRESISETYIHPTAVVEENADIGEKCYIGPHSYISGNVKMGHNCVVQANSSVGTPGFGFGRMNDGSSVRQIHDKSVILEPNVEIGANCVIDSGCNIDTVIGEGTKTDNLVHIAHNVRIGNNCWLTYGVGLSGHVTLEDQIYLHPNSKVANYVTIENNAEIGMGAAVLKDIPSYSLAVGTPAEVVGESRYA